MGKVQRKAQRKSKEKRNIRYAKGKRTLKTFAFLQSLCYNELNKTKNGRNARE